MKKLLFILFVFTLSVSTTFAQEIELQPENLITKAKKNGFTGQLEQDLKNTRNGNSQAAVIKQVGNHNEATITQNGTDLFAYILQNGNYLVAELIMEDYNNDVIIRQKGYNLFTHVKLTGHSNDLKLLQVGSDLRNRIKLLNVTGMDVQFLQTKTNFYYSQQGKIGIDFKLNSTQDVPAIIVRNN